MNGSHPWTRGPIIATRVLFRVVGFRDGHDLREQETHSKVDRFAKIDSVPFGTLETDRAAHGMD